MADYDNNLTGVLFKNDKGDNEKRPDYKGSSEIEGVQYWVSAWIRDTAKGKCLSMKYERKEQQTAAAPTAERPAPARQPAPQGSTRNAAPQDAFDDEIPF
jgi:hypothetical protein